MSTNIWEMRSATRPAASSVLWRTSSRARTWWHYHNQQKIFGLISNNIVLAKTLQQRRKASVSNVHVNNFALGPGVMNQMLDFVHQMAEESTTHVHAARELTIWLTVQVGVVSRFKSTPAKQVKWSLNDLSHKCYLFVMWHSTTTHFILCFSHLSGLFKTTLNTT